MGTSPAGEGFGGDGDGLGGGDGGGLGGCNVAGGGLGGCNGAGGDGWGLSGGNGGCLVAFCVRYTKDIQCPPGPHTTH